jgi:hypothetical protein
MAFAVTVAKGDDELSSCPFIDSAKVEALTKTINKVDWRENLIKSLKEEIRPLNLIEIADGIGASVQGDSIIIKLWGRDLLITPEREIIAEAKVSPWEKILVLLYIKMQGKVKLENQWISFAELKGGSVKVEAIKKDCEVPLSRLMQDDFDGVVKIFERLGLKEATGQIANKAWEFYMLPKLPVLILFWASVEEFPASVKLLFDPTAVQFLDIESIVFLCEGFVNKVDELLNKDK